LLGRFSAPVLVRQSSSAEVFRAYDSERGELVALKCAVDSESSTRLMLEGELLLGLSLPNLPKVVAHGSDERGRAYLATHWIDGPTLAERLRVGPLPIDDALLMARQLAQVLGTLHDRGVVHRDVKPSNLLLAGGAPGDVRLIDFGIAESHDAPRTRPGVPLGTPGFMAPEQARGEAEIEARADVFGLGAVLFAAVTGRPPFLGEGVTATLARLLFEATPRVENAPEWFEEIVRRLLAKAPADRPANGHAAALLLEPHAHDRPAISVPGWVLGDAEQRVVSVMCAALGKEAIGVDDVTRSMIPSSRGRAAGLEVVSAVTACGALGARAELVGGDVIVALVDHGPSADHRALVALECARALEGKLGRVPLAIATGITAIHDSLLTGSTIDRALRLLEAARRTSGSGVLVDRTSARLLGSRFRLEELPEGARLHDEPPRPTRESLVGRDAEIDELTRLLNTGARLLVVRGPPGIGKSRVLGEVERRIEDRVSVWRADGDVLRDARPLHVVAELTRSAFGTSLVDSVVRVLLRRQCRLRFDAQNAARITAFLGELLGLPRAPDEPIEVAAARQDPLLMADQMRRAFLDMIRALCHERGLVLMIDDLHRIDRASAELLLRALDEIGDARLAIVGAARPDGTDSLSGFSGMHELELGPLPDDDARELAREVLGGGAPSERVDTLVRKSLGNPFFLRELGQAERHTELASGASESVLSVLSAHLESLSGEARRVLRAASFYGTVFSLRALAPLVGNATPDTRAIRELTEEGFFHALPRPFVDGDPAFAFAHDLVREAAASLLTPEDLEHGHRVTGRYLAALGSADPHAVAEHFFLGRDLERGADWMVRAAERALSQGALEEAKRLGERAIAFGAAQHDLGRARLALAQVARWQGNGAEAHACARSAVETLPDSSVELARAFGELATACGRLRFADELATHTERALERLEAHPSGPWMGAACRAVVQLFYNGRSDEARVTLDRLERIFDHRFAAEPLARARLFGARSVRALFARDPVGQLEAVRAGREAFLEAGDLREACLYELTIGHALTELGHFDAAAEILREAGKTARRLGARLLENLATLNLGLALAKLGSPAAIDEAIELERATIDAVERGGDARVRCAARCYLTVALLAKGVLDEAETHARVAVELAGQASTMMTLSRAILADVLLRANRATEARVALELGPSDDAGEEGALRWLLVGSEVALALGDASNARLLLERAHEQLMAHAATIADDTYRSSFLERVAENSRIRELHAAQG
jgi:tetratricopeptide (TPR) repeat protein